MDSGLATTSAQFSQDSGMYLVRCHRLIYVQVPQVVPNLVIPYSGKGFSPLDAILQSINWGGVRREVASAD